MTTLAHQADTETLKPDDSFTLAARRIFYLFGAMAVVTVMLFGLAYSGQGPMRSVGYSSHTAPLQIVIGNDVYAIPENMIRRAQQRREGISDRVDLTVLAHTGSGYSEAELAEFANTDNQTVETVILSIAKRDSLLDMTARFHPVLKRALVPNSMTKAEKGMFEAQLSPQYGFMNEYLIFSGERDAAGAPVFVARCHNQRVEPQLLHDCETDLFVGSSSVLTVRFARHQLEQWQGFHLWLDGFMRALQNPEMS
ncbi:MAG: hypothetical protein AAGG69_14945 [Pseudomonadota bacterium]